MSGMKGISGKGMSAAALPDVPRPTSAAATPANIRTPIRRTAVMRLTVVVIMFS